MDVVLVVVVSHKLYMSVDCCVSFTWIYCTNSFPKGLKKNDFWSRNLQADSIRTLKHSAF